jgi:hypothetical protein
VAINNSFRLRESDESKFNEDGIFVEDGSAETYGEQELKNTPGILP